MRSASGRAGGLTAARTGALAAAGLVAALAGEARADVIAFQDFAGNSLLAGQVTLPGDAGAAGTVFDSGAGLGWTLDSSDLGGADAKTIGVVDTGSLAGSLLGGASGIDGPWFSAQDTDGDLVLSFDSVATAGYTGLTLGFDWAAAATPYESNDFFKVLVNGVEVFGITEPDLEASGGDFAGEVVDLSALGFDGQELTISVQFTTSAAGEEIGFDALKLEGVLVPLPGAGGLALAGLLGLGLGRRRR